MSHIKAEMHQIRFLASVRLSVCPWTIGQQDKRTYLSLSLSRKFPTIAQTSNRWIRWFHSLSTSHDLLPKIIELDYRFLSS